MRPLLLASVFKPAFQAHDDGLVRFAVTTVTLAEVLTGPLSARNEVLRGWMVCRTDYSKRNSQSLVAPSWLRSSRVEHRAYI